jgi:hypothetical protein
MVGYYVIIMIPIGLFFHRFEGKICLFYLLFLMFYFYNYFQDGRQSILLNQICHARLLTFDMFSHSF